MMALLARGKQFGVTCCASGNPHVVAYKHSLSLTLYQL
jgi:hypothetical protein